MGKRKQEHMYTLRGRDSKGEPHTFHIYRLDSKTWEARQSYGMQFESKLMHPSSIGHGIGKIKAELMMLFWLQDFTFDDEAA